MPFFEQNLQKYRTSEFTVQLFQSNGTTGVDLAIEDVVRIKVGRGIGNPHLDLSSIHPTENGSRVTIANYNSPATINVRFAQADLGEIIPGPYEMEILVVDASEVLVEGESESETSGGEPQIAIKHAQSGILQIIGSLGGEIGLT